MPLPHRFLSGASAAARVPHLVSASRQKLASTLVRSRRLEPGAVRIAQLLEQNRYASSFSDFLQPNSQWHPPYPDNLKEARQAVPTDCERDEPVEYKTEELESESEKKCYFYLKAYNDQFFKLQCQLHKWIDVVTEVRYRRWLLETHNQEFSPPQGNSSEAITQHLATVKQFLSADAVKRLDYRVDRSVFLFEHEFEHQRTEILDIAKSTTVIAFGGSNRRINAGFTPLAVLFPLAALSQQRLKFQNGKDSLKIAYTAPTFDKMTVHKAIQLSATGLHEIDLEVAYIHHSLGFSSPPTLLRTDNPVYPFYPHLRTWRPLRFPPYKRGTERLWFQPEKIEHLPDGHLGKNVIEVQASNADAKIHQQRKTREQGVSIIWYHDIKDGAPTTRRFFSSRRAWTEANNSREVLGPLMNRAGAPISPQIIKEDTGPRLYWNGVRDSGPRILWKLVGGGRPEVKRQTVGLYSPDDEALPQDDEALPQDDEALPPTVTRRMLGSENSPIMLLQRLKDGPRIIKHAVKTETRPVMLMQTGFQGEGPRIIKHLARSEERHPDVNSDESPKIRHVGVGPGIRIIRDVREYVENDRRLGLRPDDEETQSATRGPGEGPRIRHHVTARMVNPTAEQDGLPRILHNFVDEREKPPRILHSYIDSAAERRAETGAETGLLEGEDYSDVKPMIRYHPTVSPENWYGKLSTSPKTLEDDPFHQRRSYSTTSKPSALESTNRKPRKLTEHNLPQAGPDEVFKSSSSFKRFPIHESVLRKKLQVQEIERKLSITAMRQGKQFQVRDMGEAPEEMMEEAEFIQALNDLATSSVEDITETSGMEFMDIGDLVELRTFGGASQLGIFIQPPLTRNGDFLFLTESGSLKTWPTTGMVFTIPRFTRPESAELLRSYLIQLSDETIKIDPPRHLTKPLTDKIREFQKTALSVFAEKLPIIEQLHDKFAHNTETRLLTTHEAARTIFPEGFSNHQFYAVHLAMMDNPRHFIADSGRDHKKTTQFEVRSRKQLETLRTVSNWLRRQQVTLDTGKVVKKVSENIESFAVKAAALIDKSRELRGDQQSLFKPVEPVPMTEYAWDEDDKAIIEFLKCSLERYWFQVSPVAALYPQILRATNRYREEWRLDVDLLYIFLMEIGVYRPWENRFRFNSRLPLPYHNLSKEADAVADKVAEVDKDAEAAWQSLGFKDRMEPFREDISETIYAIDDPTAEEIDDGISFTPASETESWVHVHVANPTAYFEPDHWIAEMAKQKFQTIYLPEKTFGMIPRGLVDYKWGLACNRPTLTISVLLNNETANILDYKIRFCTAKNVKRLTYQNYNSIIGHISPKPYTLIINPPRDASGEIIDFHPPTPRIHLDPEEASILLRLRNVAIKLKKQRVASGCLSFINESFRIFLNDHPLDPGGTNQVSINPDIPVLYKGLPTLTFMRDEGPTPAHETVAEFMLLGGRIVSQFLSSHNIPAPYRAHSLSHRKGTEDTWKKVVLPQRNEMGIVDKKFLQSYFNLLGSSRIETTPAPHQLLGLGVDPTTGIGGYIKATSPLRRYLDMVVHFQLQRVVSNLRSGIPANSNLPFSEQFLTPQLPKALSMERRIRTFQQNAEKFFIWKLLRWGSLESKVVPGREDVMPKKFTIELSSKNVYPMPSMGRLVEFGTPIKFWFKKEEDSDQASLGSIGEAEVDDSMNSRVSIAMRWVRVTEAR